MIKMPLRILAFIILSATSSLAESFYFDYNSDLENCYNQALNLELDSARSHLRLISKKEPHNLAVLHIENYLDFLELFILEDESRFKLLEHNKNKRVKTLKAKCEDNEPYKNYVLADINLQWALVRSKFGQYFKAGREIYSAHSQLEKNSEHFPDFSAQLKTRALVNALIESIELPGILKRVLGMNASIDSAIEDISQYIGWSQIHNDFFLAEAKAINSYILYYQKLEKHRALEILNQELDNNSLLTKYLHVHLLQHNKLTEEAICYFDNHFTKADYDKFPYLHFMKGQCYLRQLNEMAEKEFHFFVNKHKGQHYIKEAYQKLAWFQFSVKSDTNQYFKMLDKVLDQAEAQMDGDIQAENEAKSRKLPNQNLLKARILFDGAYYNEAQLHLDKYESTHESNIASLYLRARIYQESGRLDKAIQIFKLLVEQHSSSQDYRITNSALQLGIIHEKLSEKFMAKEYYELCLQMKPQDYKRSMRQKAHSGLERLEKW